ncbi:MAG: glycoside hydrolase family 38 C-terminal domain-containing protein [bacterium]
MLRPFESIYEKRIQRLLARLEQTIVIDHFLLNSSLALTHTEIPFSQRTSLEYHPVSEGENWHQPQTWGWFHTTGEVPEDWAGSTVAAKLEIGGEGLVRDSRGQALQGITDRSVFDSAFFRDTVRLFDRCDGGEEIDLWIEAGISGFFGETFRPNPVPGIPLESEPPLGIVRSLRLVRLDTEAEQLLLDVRALFGIYRGLPADSERRKRLLDALNEAADLYAGEHDRIEKARERLVPELDRPAEHSSSIAVAIGHAHLDTAWLWTYAETERKVHRTFATQMRLIDRYPGYIFGASQPQHYAWLSDRDPELFERIRGAVREHRWEPLGAMWIEADCNMPSGESLVRQILHGKNYFRDEYDREVHVLWLPDAFGFPAALPQIMRRSGITSFLTQKLSWNQVNPFPHTTFRWRGIDGSVVLAHFPPEHNYCSTLDADAMIRAENNFTEKGTLEEFIVPFGAGDGGGGPREDSIELARRLHNTEGAPRVRFGSVEDFFDRLHRHEGELPEWDGELYLEAHRGTLTSQARIKQFNRRLEFLLAEVETMFSFLPLDRYPRSDLDGMWKRLLLHQFHDVLPGSSIGAVYEDVRRDYKNLRKEAESLIKRAATSMMKPDENAVSFFNPCSFNFAGVVSLPERLQERHLVTDDGDSVLTEEAPNGTIARVAIPAHGFTTLIDNGLQKGRKKTSLASDDPLVLENDHARFVFNEKGQLISGQDLVNGKFLLAENSVGNLLTLYEDLPNDWDAWDIDVFYKEAVIEHPAANQWEREHSGSLRNMLRFHYTFGNSTLIQTVSLDHDSSLLVFDTLVDWHENHRMLRTAFATSVFADKTVCDIQYGYFERPTARNTAIEQAQFEVAAHKYVDLSDGRFGVALINDGRYGHSIHENTLDLNLLRSPRYPDPGCDRGEHHFRYALYPHPGTVQDSDLVAVASCFNNPPRLFERLRPVQPLLPVRVKSAGISLEAVKAAEKEECLVLRLVEYRGRKSKGRLILNVPARIALTDLMEWETGEIQEVNGEFEMELEPFEIRTYKVWMDHENEQF